jgi:hypothetical protein
MKTRSRVKRVLHWFSKRSVFVITTLFFAIVVLLFWFVIAGFTPDNERMIIGVAAITAFLAAISAIATLLQAVEIQKQRENLERPYVIAYFDGSSSGGLYLVIENSGNSPATDVNFNFEPSPIDFAGRPLNKISLFANPISFLPAGKVIRQIIDAGFRVLEEGKPTKFTVTAKYSSVFGDSFHDVIEHDLEYLKQSTLPPKTTEDHLKKISDELEKLTQLIKNAQGSTPFLIESPDQYSARIGRVRNNRVQHRSIIKIFYDIFNQFLSKIGGS